MKAKKDSVRHTILITLGQMGKAKPSEMEDESDSEDAAEEGEEDGDVGDKAVSRMIPKKKKKGKC